MKYRVEIVETSSLTVEVEAESYQDAEYLVRTKYSGEEIVLSANELIDVEFNGIPDIQHSRGVKLCLKTSK